MVSPITPIVKTATRLTFRPTELCDISEVRPLLSHSPYRTCDFSVGGIFMWSDYFRYSHCIVDNTLFIRGMSEDDITRPAFSLPVGVMPLSESIPMLLDYCADHDIRLELSAVPEEALDELCELGAKEITELTDWSDYLYEAPRMATFSGKKLSKKRNHVNHFHAEFPDAIVTPLTPDVMKDVMHFYQAQSVGADKPLTADYERLQVLEVLGKPDVFGFEGCAVIIPGRGVVAFTMGEVIGDTLYSHIEKMDHNVAGAGEMVSSAFTSLMLERHPDLQYVNREEDTGDLGLRHAKLAYQPLRLLRKYNVSF